MLFYNTGGKCAGLQLTLQSVFMFLFLGNGVQDVFPLVWREDSKWNIDVILLQLEAVRYSQWILAWYEV